MHDTHLSHRFWMCLLPALLLTTVSGCSVSEALLDGVFGGISSSVSAVISTVVLELIGAGMM